MFLSSPHFTPKIVSQIGQSNFVEKLQFLHLKIRFKMTIYYFFMNIIIPKIIYNRCAILNMNKQFL